MIESPEIISLVESATLFRDVPHDLIEPLIRKANLVRLRPGEKLLSPERLNENVYIVISGRLSVQVTPSRTEEPIAVLTAGECVGEMSVLVDGMVSAFVIAQTECELVSIGYVSFWEFIDGSNKAARNMLNILVHRIRLGNEVVADNLLHRDYFQERNLIDGLTGLYNQHGMLDKFDRLFRRAAVDRHSICLIILEADKFDSVKDSEGGLGGDQSLRTIAQTMLSFLRPDDHAARLIGKKFAVLLVDAALNDAVAAAERLGAALGQVAVVLPNGTTLPHFTISAGVSEAGPDDTWNRLLERADHALGLAIAAGGNQVVTG